MTVTIRSSFEACLAMIGTSKCSSYMETSHRFLLEIGAYIFADTDPQTQLRFRKILLSLATLMWVWKRKSSYATEIAPKTVTRAAIRTGSERRYPRYLVTSHFYGTAFCTPRWLILVRRYLKIYHGVLKLRQSGLNFCSFMLVHEVVSNLYGKRIISYRGRTWPTNLFLPSR